MKKIISMLLAVAMVMSLCVNVFAVTEKNYYNGAGNASATPPVAAEEKLVHEATGKKEVKVVVFDSDQTQTSAATGKVMKLSDETVADRYYDALPANSGYNYYDVTLKGRVVMPGAAPSVISGGVLLLTLEPNSRKENLFGSGDETTLLVQDADRVRIKAVTGERLTVDDAIVNSWSGNMQQPPAGSNIVKARFPFGRGVTTTSKPDAVGNKYWEFEIVFKGIIGKPGDEFTVTMEPYVDSTDINQFVYLGTPGAAPVHPDGGTQKKTPGVITIPKDVVYVPNGGKPDDLREKIENAGVGVTNRTKTAEALGLTRGDDILLGWSDTKITKALTDRSEIPAVMYKPGEILTVNKKMFDQGEIYAVWAANELGDPIDEDGDPIPGPTPDLDKVVVNLNIKDGDGQWINPASNTKKIVLLADADGNTKLTNAHLRDFVSNTASHYVNLSNIKRNDGKDPAKGSWDTRPVAATLNLDNSPYNYTFSLGTKANTYTYINGENGKKIEVAPSDPYSDPTKKPDPGTVIKGTDPDNGPGPISYIVTEIGDPNTDNESEVIAYPDKDDDGNRDQFQVNITFKLEGGTWDSGKTEEKISFEIKDGTKYTWFGTDAAGYPVGVHNYNANIPDVTKVKPDDDHETTGAWDVTPPGSVNGNETNGQGKTAYPRNLVYTYTLDSKDIVIIDNEGNQLEIVKVLRWSGEYAKDWIHTNEPTNRGYDPSMISATVYASSNGNALEGNAANLTKVQNYINGAKYYHLKSDGTYEELTGALFTKYTQTPEVAIKKVNGKDMIGITFTSNNPGVVKVVFNEGDPVKQSEFVFFTPGDVDLNGEMNANDWQYVMRWLSEDVQPLDCTYEQNSFKNFTVNGNPYQLWALMADMTSTDIELPDTVLAIKQKYVDANDWTTMMYLLSEAWK